MNVSRTLLLTLSCCLLVAPIARSQDIVQSIAWSELAAAHQWRSGTVVAATGAAEGPSLRVVHASPAPATFPLLTIERPAIRLARYALRGRVRYEGVAAGSYLEMWNHLPEGAFFSRTLDQTGPMGRLEGSSDWRAFVLPFFNREGGPPPDRLVVNLVLTGTGTVEIGPLELVQFGSDETPLADSTAWWSNRQGGMVGGVAGSLLGLLGAVIGWLASAGRAKGLVLGTLKAIAWTGVAALALGGWAVAGGQPYAVYYPLLLLGTLGAALGFSLPRTLGKRYEELELRRMQALDA